MIELRRFVVLCSVVAAALATGCIRGRLPAREFYRLPPQDSALFPTRPPGVPPLTESIAIAPFDTPGIYASGSIVYRIGATHYGAYPSREWAIPLGEMLGSLSEAAVRRGAITSGGVYFGGPSSPRAAYEWRGAVREFDEVDDPTGVAASVALTVQLVRVVDDSVIWSGTAHERQNVRESRSMDAVVQALSNAASRALSRLAGDAAAALRRLAAASARER